MPGTGRASRSRPGVLLNSTFAGDALAGAGGSRDASGSGTAIVSHDNAAGLSHLRLVRMQALFVRNGSTEFDRAKTNEAKCREGSTLYCVYP